MNLYWLQARFLNLDWTVRSDRKTLELSTSTARLRWRTVPYEKSMNLYGPWFDRTILWTMIGSHGSNGCLVSSLKMASFHLFFFFFPIWRRLEHTHWTKFNPETMKTSPHSLNHSLSFLPLPHSLNYISRLCLSPSSPSQLSPNRSSVHIAGHSLNHSLPLSHSHLCLSLSSPS